MDRLTRLPVPDAEKVLLRVIRECQESGKFSQYLTLPSERRFIDRQYVRVMETLADIAEHSEGDPSAEKARRALEVNRRALEQHEAQRPSGNRRSYRTSCTEFSAVQTLRTTTRKLSSTAVRASKIEPAPSAIA
jgi:hypothetical protein